MEKLIYGCVGKEVEKMSVDSACQCLTNTKQVTTVQNVASSESQEKSPAPI